MLFLRTWLGILIPCLGVLVCLLLIVSGARSNPGMIPVQLFCFVVGLTWYLTRLGMKKH